MREKGAPPDGGAPFVLPPGGVTFASSGGVERSVQRERACAPSPFGNSLPVGWAIIKSRLLRCKAPQKVGAARCAATIWGVRIPTPACGLARNDRTAESSLVLSFRGAKRRGNPFLSSLFPGTAVEGETPTVAAGSGSEAVAESCGGTVLLTDSGTRENRLREEHKANLRQGIAR